MWWPSGLRLRLSTLFLFIERKRVLRVSQSASEFFIFVLLVI